MASKEKVFTDGESQIDIDMALNMIALAASFELLQTDRILSRSRQKTYGVFHPF